MILGAAQQAEAKENQRLVYPFATIVGHDGFQCENQRPAYSLKNLDAAGDDFQREVQGKLKRIIRSSYVMPTVWTIIFCCLMQPMRLKVHSHVILMVSQIIHIHVMLPLKVNQQSCCSSGEAKSSCAANKVYISKL